MDSETIWLFPDLMKYGPPNRDVRVLSEKMKNASIHHETEYAVFMKSNIFVSSQRPRARANNPDAMNENISMQYC